MLNQNFTPTPADAFQVPANSTPAEALIAPANNNPSESAILPNSESTIPSDAHASESFQTSVEGEVVIPCEIDERTEREKYLDFLGEQCTDASVKINKLRDELNSNPEYKLLLFNYLEPYLDDFRAKMKYIEHHGHAQSMVPYNWSLGSSEDLPEVPARVQLRNTVSGIIATLRNEMSHMEHRNEGNTELLRNLYLAMSTARYADDVLNKSTNRRADNRAPHAPKIKKQGPGRGGARKGAGRPRKNPLHPAAEDSTQDETPDNPDEN